MFWAQSQSLLMLNHKAVLLVSWSSDPSYKRWSYPTEHLPFRSCQLTLLVNTTPVMRQGPIRRGGVSIASFSGQLLYAIQERQGIQIFILPVLKSVSVLLVNCGLYSCLWLLVYSWLFNIFQTIPCETSTHPFSLHSFIIVKINLSYIHYVFLKNIIIFFTPAQKHSMNLRWECEKPN